MLPAWSDARKMVRRASKLDVFSEPNNIGSPSAFGRELPLTSGDSPHGTYSGQSWRRSILHKMSLSSLNIDGAIPVTERPATINETTTFSPRTIQANNTTAAAAAKQYNSLANKNTEIVSPSTPLNGALPSPLSASAKPMTIIDSLHQNNEQTNKNALSSVGVIPVIDENTPLTSAPNGFTRTNTFKALEVPSLYFDPVIDAKAVYHILMSSPLLSSFLIFVPLGIIAHISEWHYGLTFVANFLGIIPLAWLLGNATEEIALRTNPTLGGLLNATFGNAVELIVSVVALRKGFIKLVQTSLLGSILSNMLLVLGMSFFLGGLCFNKQTYNRAGANIFASMLLLACLALTIPSAYVNAFHLEVNIGDTLDISRATAAIMFVVYLLYLYFQLYTHTNLFVDENDAILPTATGTNGDVDETSLAEEVLMDQPSMSAGSAIMMLTAVTLAVAACSEYLVSSIEPVTRAYQLNQAFVGIILLPIVGNAAEHATAVTVAMKNKMDLSIGVAIGSSTQIALFLIPFVVLLGWIIGQPMTLNFDVFGTIVLVLSVLIVNFIVKDGESNWLVGFMLMAAYAIIATSFYFVPMDVADET